jgi:hypothetical protein
MQPGLHSQDTTAVLPLGTLLFHYGSAWCRPLINPAVEPRYAARSRTVIPAVF